MEYLLISVIGMMFVYMAYTEHQHRRERENLQMLIKSNDVYQYADTRLQLEEEITKQEEKKEDTYVDLDEVPTEKLLKAKDNI